MIKKIYIAGPLFNVHEKKYLEDKVRHTAFLYLVADYFLIIGSIILTKAVLKCK